MEAADLPSERGPEFKLRLVTISCAVVLLNTVAWLWAFVALGRDPTLLGLAFVAYGLGLRHAVDADHIAAIDNVTRKLRQSGSRPLSVGFWFAMGHSTVVLLVAAAVAGTANLLGKFQGIREVGGTIGTSVSATFLFAIAATNTVIFASVYRTYRRVKNGEPYEDEDLSGFLDGRSWLSRWVRPLFRLVTRSWHMFPLGFAFGLGFDTATEITMFSVSATQAANGASAATIVLLPVLFAAGMSLIDTADGLLMLGAYEWAFVSPMRKLYYNMTITLISVLVALVVGGSEALGLIESKLDGLVGHAIGALNANSSGVGFAVIGVFATLWLTSYTIQRLTNPRLEPTSETIRST